MAVLSRSVYVLSIIDALVIACVSFIGFSFVAHTYAQLFIVVGLFLFSVLFLLGMKGFYKIRKYGWKDIYLLFEGILVGSFLGAILAIPILKDFVIGMFLDLGVSKAVVDVRGNRVDSQCRTSISDLGEDQLLKVELALTPELCGKAAYKVYRIHDDVAEALPTNGKGERIEVNETKDKLTIYTYKFSTYAIYYSDEEVLDADTPTTEVSSGGKDNESAGVVLEEPPVKKKNMFLILIAGITIVALAGSGAVCLRKNK